MIYFAIAALLMFATFACGRVLHARHRRLKRVQQLREMVRRSAW